MLVDGEVAGAINRRPGAGEIRSNLAAGVSGGSLPNWTETEQGDLRRPRTRAQTPRAAVLLGYRRHWRPLADGNQRDFANRNRRNRPVQWNRHGRINLAGDRASLSQIAPIWQGRPRGSPEIIQPKRIFSRSFTAAS